MKKKYSPLFVDKLEVIPFTDIPIHGISGYITHLEIYLKITIECIEAGRR